LICRAKSFVARCTLSAALIGIATAQNRLSFSDALAQVGRNNPQVKAAEARVRSAQGLSLQARLKPNPRGILQFENYRAWESPPFSLSNSPDNYALFSQLIERGGKRQRRVASADAIVMTA